MGYCISCQGPPLEFEHNEISVGIDPEQIQWPTWRVGLSTNKAKILARLRRIEGQVRGVQRMVEDDKYCIDILTQVSALTRALQGVATGLLEDHLSHCVVDAARMGDEEARVKIKEATDAINRLVRS